VQDVASKMFKPQWAPHEYAAMALATAAVVEKLIFGFILAHRDRAPTPFEMTLLYRRILRMDPTREHMSGFYEYITMEGTVEA
jgi:hypothetical protein